MQSSASFEIERNIDADSLLRQFNRLIQDILRGSLVRNTFRPWEIELLLDIETCEIKDGQKRETMRRYQRAVQRHMEKGATAPMKLSEYLEANRLKRETDGESLSDAPSGKLS
jgi:hypothetical protein